MLGRGQGRTKKAAQQSAARDALTRWDSDPMATGAASDQGPDSDAVGSPGDTTTARRAFATSDTTAASDTTTAGPKAAATSKETP